MFSYKQYESLEEVAAHPTAVRRLSLTRPGLDFGAFSSILPQLSGVREIHLGWQSWVELPHELSKLRELRSLTVLNTPIRCFPAFLASCPHLTELVLRGTDIATIPASVQEFRSLRHLDVSNSPLIGIPGELGCLPELRELILADDGLSTLPDSLIGLRRLRSLVLAGNPFTGAEASRIRGWFRQGVVSVWGNDDIVAVGVDCER